MALIRLEVRIVLVRDCQARVERQRATERLLGARRTVRRAVDIFAEYPIAPAESSPCGRESRVELQALLIQVPRGRETVVSARQLVGSEVQLVGPGIVRRVGRWRRRGAGQGQRQGVDDAPG